MKQFLSVIILSFGITVLHSQIKQDTIAIKQLLEKESATWRSGDSKTHSACWHVQPYSKIIISTIDGKVLNIPASVMVTPPAGVMGKGGNSINSNYSFSVQGNAAWVYHDEVSIAADGTKSYSHEIRILEKIQGKWKLVAQSIHAYKPE